MSGKLVGFYRNNGAGSMNGYALAYRGTMGDMQVLVNERAKPVIFSKRDTHAANYGKMNDARRVHDAMNSPAWGRI